MGRPEKEIKRDTYVKIYLTQKEKDNLKNQCKSSAYPNLNEMLRDKIFNSRYKVVTLDANLARETAILITESKRIGNNFTQLLKLLHSKKLNYFTKEDVESIKINLNSISKHFKKMQK